MRRIIIFTIFTLYLNIGYTQSTGDVYDIVTIDELDPKSIFNKIWQPFIAQWDEDTYLVAYGRQIRGKTDMGDIVCSVSNDKGKSWNPAVTVFDHTVPNGSQKFAYNNAVLYKDPDQDIIWCYAMRCPQYYRDSEDSELCAAYSGDGGKSWHQVELMVDFHSPLITCAGIVKIQGSKEARYLLPVHRNTKRHDPLGDRQQFVLESRDLLHWKLANYIPQPEQKVFMHEGNIADWLNPGQLKIVMRTGTYQEGGKSLDPPVAYSSVSEDGGKTWSAGKPEPALFNTVSKAFLGKDSLNRHIYVYSSGPAWERKELYYKLKEPNSEWSEARLFYFDNNRNSYPTLIEEKKGEWLCVWDSSNDPDVKRTAIRFGRLNTNKQ